LPKYLKKSVLVDAQCIGQGPALYVQTKDGYREVRAGDWVVTDEHGKEIYDQDTFHELFEPADAD
jgi:hypothetical protein